MSCDGFSFASVVAVDRAWCIGKDNAIPWHLPADLKHFKQVTMGGRIIMGRRTHESIGRPLPGRENVVLSGREGYVPAPGCVHHESIDALCDGLGKARETQQNFIIGGARVYEEFLPLVNTIYLTVVDTVVEGGDTFISPLDPACWELVSSSVHEADTRHAHRFVMHELRRVKRAQDGDVCGGEAVRSLLVPDRWLP